MFQIEIKLLKNRKLILPTIVLLIALIFIAFITYWVGANKKQLEGTVLAIFVATRATQSGTLALFFLFWMLQFGIHLQNSGFYKMLLHFGWKRDVLLIYCMFQIGLYSILLMALNYSGFALLSFFYGTNPLQLVIQSDVNALISQFLYLFATGLFAIVLAYIRSNHLLILPVFVYWLFEGWLSSFLKKQEMATCDFFPLLAMRQIISENLLEPIQIITIGLYIILFVFALYFLIQKKSFV